MIDSYFFVPGDKLKFLNNIKNLNADYFVIDLEDAVSVSNKELAFNNLIDLEISYNTFVRIPFKDNFYSEKQIAWLMQKFGGRILLPKVSTVNEVKDFISTYYSKSDFELNIILLVENPLCFLNISSILSNYSNYISAISFGTYDFCEAIGMKHNNEHLKSYKKQLILIAKAFNTKYIDGTELNIRDLSDFTNDCIYAFDAGADGKCVVHPAQLEKMQNIDYFSPHELEEMKEVYMKLELINRKDLDILEVNGQVYEKPHLLKIEKIFEKINKRQNRLNFSRK